MKKMPSLSKLLEHKKFPGLPDSDKVDDHLKKLQLRLLRIQQGLWHQKKRVVIAFEGFDASGKGGAIRRLTETMDPRGFKVHPIGPPDKEDQAKHYLYRFWKDLPEAGSIAIFDRTWYGRVLVEKVEKLTSPERLHQAYKEIRETEEMWMADGIEVVKIFLAIDKKEQFKRFEERLKDPYKQWKITKEDVEARDKWNHYVKATDKMFSETHTKICPWHLIPANDKQYARQSVLELVIEKLAPLEHWMESKSRKKEIKTLAQAVKELGLKKSALRK